MGKTFFSKVIVVLFATLVMITMVPPYQNAAATGQTFTINSVSQCTSTSDYTTDTSSGCTINNLNLQPGDTLNIGFQSVAVNLGTDGVNSGIINISSLSLLSTNGHALTNNGVINISGGVFVSSWDNFLHAGNLINNGLIQVTSGGQLQTDGGGLTDNGQITIDGSAHSGLFEDVPQGVQGAATDTITNGGSITSAGEIQVYAISVQPGGTLSTTNVVNAYGFLSNSGTFTTTSQIFTDTFNNNGHLTLTGSSLIDARFFNNNNGGVVDNSSPQFNIGSGNSNEASGTFVNNGGGTVNNHGAMNMFGGINNSGLLRNYGSFTVDSYGQPIYNPGTIIAECGSTPISDIINGIQQIFPNGITNGCVPPTLTISSPANNVNLNANTLTISGTASAAFPITTITWSVDNGQTTTASGTTSWSFSTGQLADGTHTIMVTATDNNGNTATKSVSVTIDTDLPSITVPSPITSQATGPHGAVVTYTATGSDNPDGPITPVCTPASGSTFALGSTTVNCSVTDKAGNIAHASFQVTVQDTISPTLKLPANITQEATGPSGAPVTFSATATDIVDGTDPVTCTPASGSTFALGSTTVNCSSTDAHGNTASGSFHITVQDTTAPTITVTNINAKATGPSGAPVTFSATATDIVDGTDPVTCDHNSGDTYPLGSTTVSCSSTDHAGNTSHASFTITVAETTAPSITLPGTITQEATGPSGAPVTFSATATDIVDGTDPVTCTPASGSTFALGSTTVNCSSTNHAGNTATASFQVTVQDTISPTLKLPANITQEATGPSGAPVTFSATATDIVDGTDPVTCTPASGSTFALGSTTVNCSSTDAHGNTASGSFHITVQDTTAPVLALPTPITATATSTAGAPVTFSATATDIVDGTDPVTCTPASGSTFALGTATVTCTTSDLHSNTSTGSFTVTVNPGPVSTVKISPPTATTIVGSTPIQFTATSQDQFGNIRTGDTLTWSVVSGGGSISSTGLYTPGTTADAATITATDGSASGTATITLNPGQVTSVTVSPSTVTLTSTQTQQFTATSQDQFGNIRTGDTLTWSVVSGGGSISSTGLYTPGTTAGTTVIAATDNSISGSATVTANNPNTVVQNQGGANLKGDNLQFLNLSNFNLSGDNLKGVTLQGSDLQGANLAGANLASANLQNVNLAGANLSGANLQGVDLSGANLQGANLKGANLQGTNLQNDNLLGANLQGNNLQGANLSGANLQNANLSGANLQSANLQNANISGANLTGANVHKANLQGTITSGITPSTLSGCLNNSVCQ